MSLRWDIKHLLYIWVEYKKEHIDEYQYTQFAHYFHEFVKENYSDIKLFSEIIPKEN